MQGAWEAESLKAQAESCTGEFAPGEPCLPAPGRSPSLELLFEGDEPTSPALVGLHVQRYDPFGLQRCPGKGTGTSRSQRDCQSRWGQRHLGGQHKGEGDGAECRWGTRRGRGEEGDARRGEQNTTAGFRRGSAANPQEPQG